MSITSTEETVPVEDILRAVGSGKIGENPPPSAVEAFLGNLRANEHWVQAGPGRRALLRSAVRSVLKKGKVLEAKDLVDTFLPRSERAATDIGDKKRTLVFKPLEPWPDEVDGDELVSGLVAVLQKYVVFPPGASVATALWTLFTYAFEAFDVSPYLSVSSATKGCGKTTLLTVLESLVWRAISCSDANGPTLFRTIELYHPVLLLDECDSFLKADADIRGILNSGHIRNGSVLRCVGDDHIPERFETWGPKALFGIGKRPGTLEDRSIGIMLQRKRKDEQVERVRIAHVKKAFKPLRRRMKRWAQDNLDALEDADPSMPDLKTDRAIDNWMQLIAVADLCGGEWPDEARKAAVLIDGARKADEDQDVKVQLVHDLRDLFRSEDMDRLSSQAIVEALGEMDDRPWPEWKNSKPLSKAELSRLLKSFDIKPGLIRPSGGKPVRGYRLEHLRDTFNRYPPADEVLPPLQANKDREDPAISECYTDPDVTPSESPETPCKSLDVTGATGPDTLLGDNEYPPAQLDSLVLAQRGTEL